MRTLNRVYSGAGAERRRVEAERDNGHKEKNGFYAKISVSNKVSSRELLVMTLKYSSLDNDGKLSNSQM